MLKISTLLDDVLLISPIVHSDSRGHFLETYSEFKMRKLGINSNFVQDNQSYTKQKGTIRGIHFQNAPMAQAKLVRVISGAILDVVVDLRKGSPTYLQWITIELNSLNKHMLFVPRGYGHGFLTLTNDVELCYKVDNPYSKEHDRSIRFDDPTIGVVWNITDPILSEKDRTAPTYVKSDCNLIYGHL